METRQVYVNNAGKSTRVTQNTPFPIDIAAITAGADAFTRFRISNPFTIFDSKQIFDDPDLASNVENQPLFFDNQQVSGGGTATAYSANRASTTLSVSASTAGRRVRQSRKRFNYQPGKSQLVIFTEVFGAKVAGVKKRAGIYDDNNGIFLELDGTGFSWNVRSYVTGSAVDNQVQQSNWNIDKLDGTGLSGLTMDPTKIQIPFLDFEWLGAGTVACGFLIDRKAYYCHYFNHANLITSVYMSTPNVPLRCEIINDGSGGAASLEQVCATVISEGGSEDTGVVRYVSTGGTQLLATTENVLYGLIGIRLNANYLGATVKLLQTVIQVQTATSKCEYVLLFNPTVATTGPAPFTYNHLANSAIDVAYGVTANTVTGGTAIGGGFVESGGVVFGAAGSDTGMITNALTLGSLIAGTADTIVLCVRPIAGSTNVDVEGSITFRELL